MDALDIFRKLTKGVTFDFRKIQNNAIKSELTKSKPSYITDVKNSPYEESSTSEIQLENSKFRSNENNSDEVDRRCLKRKFEDEPVKKPDDDLDVILLNSFKSSKKTHQAKTQKGKKLKSTKYRLAELKQEQINHFRNKNKISVWGTDVPDPICSFSQLEDFHIHPKMLSNILNSEYHMPTPIQMQAIPAMLHRRELLACAPTGSGKTAAFLIPIFHHLKEPRKNGFRAVIVAPTRELAQQIYLEACRLSDGLGFQIYIIDKVNKAIKRFGPTKFKKLDILVTTPNRLIYLLNQEPSVLSLKSTEWLIIDESDKLFETGATGFRDQLATIFNACDSSNIRRAMFSATFSYEVEEWCKLNLDNLVIISIGIRNTAVNLIEQELLFVGNESGKLIAFRDLVKKGIQPPVLVFVQTKERAQELFNELIYDGINVDVIHADRTQLQRENSVKSFRSGKIWILISTELMGRGIDFKGVNLVINYDFPPSAISYIHRIGRTGRAGRSGKAITFFTEDDVVNLKSIAQIMKESGFQVPQYMLKLKKPNKTVKRKLSSKASKRNSISTIPQYDLERKDKLKKIINKTKLEKRKQKLQHNMT